MGGKKKSAAKTGKQQSSPTNVATTGSKMAMDRNHPKKHVTKFLNMRQGLPNFDRRRSVKTKVPRNKISTDRPKKVDDIFKIVKEVPDVDSQRPLEKPPTNLPEKRPENISRDSYRTGSQANLKRLMEKQFAERFQLSQENMDAVCKQAREDFLILQQKGFSSIRCVERKEFSTKTEKAKDKTLPLSADSIRAHSKVLCGEQLLMIDMMLETIRLFETVGIFFD